MQRRKTGRRGKRKWWIKGSTEDCCDVGIGVEDGRSERERAVRGADGSGLEKTQHVFGGLT